MLDLPVHIDRHLYYPSSHPNQYLSLGASLLIPHCNFLDFLNLPNHQCPTTYVRLDEIRYVLHDRQNHHDYPTVKCVHLNPFFFDKTKQLQDHLYLHQQLQDRTLHQVFHI